MFVFEYIIDNSGSLIYPSYLPVSPILDVLSVPCNHQVTVIYYDDIEINSNGTVTPITPVLSGLGGNIQIQARSTKDSVWSNIQNGNLTLSSGENMAFPAGIIYQVKAVCTGVTGCNYILIRLDRGV